MGGILLNKAQLLGCDQTITAWIMNSEISINFKADRIKETNVDRLRDDRIISIKLVTQRRIK